MRGIGLARTYNENLKPILSEPTDLVRYTVYRILSWGFNNKSDYDPGDKKEDLQEFLEDYADHYHIRLRGDELDKVLEIYNSLNNGTMKIEMRNIYGALDAGKDFKDIDLVFDTDKEKSEEISWLQDYVRECKEESEKIGEIARSIEHIMDRELPQDADQRVRELTRDVNEILNMSRYFNEDYYTPMNQICVKLPHLSNASNGLYNMARAKSNIPAGQIPSNDNKEQAMERLINTVIIYKTPELMKLATNSYYSEAQKVVKARQLRKSTTSNSETLEDYDDYFNKIYEGIRK